MVVGFLGSGKTTLLRRMAQTAGTRRLMFLVNEFSSADVDGRLVRMEGADVIALPGGSVFCRCLTTALMDSLARIARRTRERPVDGLVVEASGLADPRVARDVLRELGLDQVFVLRSVVAVADARRVVRLARTLPVLRAQIEAADLVLLNKCDLATPADIETAEAWIRSVRPDVDLRRCVRAETDADLFSLTAAPRSVHGEWAPARSPMFVTLELVPPRPTDLSALATAAREAGPDLLRMKGFVHAGDRTALIQWDGETFVVEPAPAGVPPLLVVVVRDGSVDAVRQRLERALSSGTV